MAPSNRAAPVSAAGPPQGAGPLGGGREASLGGKHTIETQTDLPAAMTGLVLAVAIAVWWMGSTRLALDHGTDAGRSAADALNALWLVRGMALAILSVRAGALYGWRRGAKAGLGLISLSWPLVALAWSASATSLTQVMLAELLLLVGSAALPLIGLFLRRSLRRVELAVMAGTGVGTALAAALWVASGPAYLPWP
jgi:hypothetical protein